MKLFSKIAYHSTKQKGLTQFRPVTDNEVAFKGEGAMIHGWGLYLQEDKELNLERYRNELVDNDNSIYKFFVYFVNGFHKVLYAKGYDEDDIFYLHFNDSDSFGDWEFYDNQALDKKSELTDGQILALRILCTYKRDFAIKVLEDELNRTNNNEDDTDPYGNEIPENYSEQVREAIMYAKSIERVNCELVASIGASQYTVEIPDDFVFLSEDGSNADILPEPIIRKIIEIHIETVISRFKYEMEKKPSLYTQEKLNKYLKMKDAWLANPVETYKSYMNDDGRTIYGFFASNLHGEKEASEYLLSQGIDGIEYDGETDGHCYVIFNCKDLKIIGEE